MKAKTLSSLLAGVKLKFPLFFSYIEAASLSTGQYKDKGDDAEQFSYANYPLFPVSAFFRLNCHSLLSVTICPLK